jgi:very-short-patch-repair endonuclease
VADYGHLIVDECHHISAHSFEQVVRRAKAKYVTGLSATVTRKDGHHPIIFMQCGPVRHRVDAKSEAAARPFEHRVLVRPTSFRPIVMADPDQRVQFQQLYQELASDDERNRMICADVERAIDEERSPLVLTERREHLDELANRLRSCAHVVTLHGGLNGKHMDEMRNQLTASINTPRRVLVATGRYIGEGFDDARLDTLFLTLPISWQGTVAQYVGRLHRLHDSKKEVRVYDYADLGVPMLSRMFDRRCQGYEAVGYTIQIPGSAVPGWPADVDLPIDAQWKSEYSASVQRLVRDGVDAPLAKLFVHAARTHDENAEGIKRARSASEAFLFRRLESLKETTGQFRLNIKLPIAFDGWGEMEVDFLNEQNRVIEIDGDQHLANREAYRRDRRKDLLVQQNGYTILRFMAVDIGSHLNEVLDSIIRALAHRRQTR